MELNLNTVYERAIVKWRRKKDNNFDDIVFNEYQFWLIYKVIIKFKWFIFFFLFYCDYKYIWLAINS